MEPARIQRWLARFAALGCVAALVLFALSARADLVETADRKTVEGRIAAVADEGVRTAAGALVAWADVRRVVFDRPPVRAVETRLLLRDGSSVCGLVRRLTNDRIVFRSVSAGELDLGLDQVAALQFAGGAALDTVRNVSGSNVVAVLRSGLVRSGTLVFVSANNVLVKTADGLEKMALENLTGLVSGRVPPPGGPGVVLRNGDVLCAPPQWGNGALKVCVGGLEVTIAFEALAEIRR
ncbi:MAG: hypothetical protein WCI17_06225 [bacterium]